MPQILIVEDEPIIRSALRRMLERARYQVAEAGSIQEAQEYHRIPSFDLIISDLRLPGAPGTELIKLAQGKPVLIMTSYASLRSAVDSMRLGAVDYIAKPFDHQDMLESVERILNKAKTKNAPKVSDSDMRPERTLGLLGSCPSMQVLYSHIHKVAPTQSTVLILGESGTGKELVARALHQQSKRAQAPLICVNCAAIPESLIESELFGHEKGAFTGAHNARTGLVEAADGGTLFLDEIGELPLEAQARLLRVLQEGEIRRVGAVQSQHVDVRLIAATHRDLKHLAQTGAFREDLYYRLHVISLQVPALRERGADILEIAQAFLTRQASTLGRTDLILSQAACALINQYSWPGNVRELENAIERSVILCEGTEISPELLGIDAVLKVTANTLAEPTSNNNSAPETTELSLEEYFQHFVTAHQHQMSETELAKKLGISRKCLWERRKRFGLPRSKVATTH